MTRSLIIALAAWTTLAGSQQAGNDRGPGVRLRIDAFASDSRGGVVTDLKAEDLEVWIAGYRVPIDGLTLVTPDSGEHGGRTLVLLLDDTVVPMAQTPRVRDAARRFVNQLMPGDRMAIVPLNGGAMEISDDRRRLLRSVDEYNVRAGTYGRLDIAGEHVLNTVTKVSRQLAEESTGHKAIVGIGAGWLFDSPIPPANVGRDLRPEWTAAIRASSFANVSVYAIDPGGIGRSPFGGSSGFARETGGTAFVNVNDINSAVDRIMREIGSYYIIEVADPPIQRSADLRDLDVRVHRRGVTVRAPRHVPGTEAPVSAPGRR